MSISVLIGQSARWEGAGKERHRIAIPPAPETLAKIKDLISAVTGFSTERGDQIIVETLPFDSVMNAEDPQALTPSKTDSRKPNPFQQWIDMIEQYKYGIPIAVGLGLLALTPFFAIARMIVRGMGGKKRKAKDQRMERTLPPGDSAGTANYAPDRAIDRAPADTAAAPLTEAPEVAELPAPPTPLPGTERYRETVKRIQDQVDRDMNAGVNVLRLWLNIDEK
jgi:flagellar M-ring protein FliF